MNLVVSPELESVLRYSLEEAMRTGHYGIGVDHLMLGILRLGDSEAMKALEELGINPADFKERLELKLFRDNPVPWSDKHLMGFTKGADNALNLSVYEALKWGVLQTGPEQLLLAISRSERSASKSYLDEHGSSHGILTEYFRRRGCLSAIPDATLPKAEEIASALHAQLNKVIGVIPIRTSDIYS